MTTLFTALGWAVMLYVFVRIAIAEFKGEGVFHFKEDE